MLEILNRHIVLSDVLEPCGKIFGDILEEYMMKDELEVEEIMVEDEYIDITHPRNLLNVLLYLNETFQVPLLELFSIYIYKVLRFGHIEIVRRLLQ